MTDESWKLSDPIWLRGEYDRLRAIIARAQSLAEKWQVDARQNLPVGLEDDAAGWRDGADWADVQCSRELLAVLRGES